MNDQFPKMISGYKHHIASHCESGTVRNLLLNAGLEISEPMVFGIGSGVAFYYVFFAKGPSGFPLVALRTPPGSIVRSISKRLKINIVTKRYRTTNEAIEHANRLIDAGTPVALCVDMFYMKYLPAFIQVHAPFHFIVLVGRDGDDYAVSDPYYNGIGRLPLENLKAAWATNASMAKDNHLFYLDEAPPAEVDLRPALKYAIKKTCDNMNLPPVVGHLLWFVGVRGMRTYARKMLQWPALYKGVQLREGILFNAIAFEDQGTGGGAFRLLYGAFLQEVAKVFDSEEMRSFARRIIAHGDEWKELSRKLIRIGKTVPMDNDAYPDWFKENAAALNAGLKEVSDTFLTFADFEAGYFKELSAALQRLP